MGMKDEDLAGLSEEERAALADDDRAGQQFLPAETLHAKAPTF